MYTKHWSSVAALSWVSWVAEDRPRSVYGQPSILNASCRVPRDCRQRRFTFQDHDLKAKGGHENDYISSCDPPRSIDQGCCTSSTEYSVQ